MLPPGFGPGFTPREGIVLDRTTLQERLASGRFELPSEDPESPMLDQLHHEAI